MKPETIVDDINPWLILTTNENEEYWYSVSECLEDTHVFKKGVYIYYHKTMRDDLKNRLLNWSLL